MVRCAGREGSPPQRAWGQGAEGVGGPGWKLMRVSLSANTYCTWDGPDPGRPHLRPLRQSSAWWHAAAGHRGPWVAC